MLTGRHWVRDVFCKKCNDKVGWMYEFALEEQQKYKEGKVILEKALVRYAQSSKNKSRFYLESVVQIFHLIPIYGDLATHLVTGSFGKVALFNFKEKIKMEMTPLSDSGS